MKGIIKSTLILVAITLVAGLALAAVYEVTKAPIESAEQIAKENAYRMVMPDAEQFTAMELSETADVNECMQAMAHEEIIGWVVNVTSPNGYGGDITLAVGISSDFSLNGISVISQSETAGLGAKCTDKAFTEQFAGMSGPVSFVKGEAAEPNRISAISGATITTTAVTEAVNTALEYVKGEN